MIEEIGNALSQIISVLVANFSSTAKAAGKYVTICLVLNAILTMNDSSSPHPSPSAINYAAYVEQTADLLGLALPDEYRDSVIENFTQLSAIAQPVMDFPLPPHTEIAPVFKP